MYCWLQEREAMQLVPTNIVFGEYFYVLLKLEILTKGRRLRNAILQTLTTSQAEPTWRVRFTLWFLLCLSPLWTLVQIPDWSIACVLGFQSLHDCQGFPFVVFLTPLQLKVVIVFLKRFCSRIQIWTQNTTQWSVEAERSSSLDPSSLVVSCRVWVQIPAMTLCP